MVTYWIEQIGIGVNFRKNNLHFNNVYKIYGAYTFKQQYTFENS